MTDVLDIARIEQELQDLNKQRSEARERLDALRPGRGRGRGPPGGGRGEGRGVFSRLGDAMNGGPGSRVPRDSSGRPSVFDRLYAQGGRGQEPDRDAAAAAREQDEGPHSRRLGSRITSRISSEVVGPAGADRKQQQQHKDEPRERERDVHRERERPDAAAGRKRLLSAVMVNGQARQLSGSMDRLVGDAEAAAAAAADEPPAKRPTIAVDDKSKRRAARMFGTLLVGTLQKFQNDEQAFKRSDTAQRRVEMEKRAQERAEAEAQRLREEAAASWREEREAKVTALHELNLQADLKALELRFAKRIQHKQQLLGFCVTRTQPPLHWQPKVASKASDKQLKAHQASFEVWKRQLAQELEAERAELVQASAEKREAAVARLAGRQPPAAGQGAGEGAEDNGNGDGDGDAMSEEHEAVASGDEGAAGDDGRQQEQDQGNEEQQYQQDDDMQEAEGDVQSAEEQEQEDEQPQPQQRLRRPQHRADDDEERLLSSDDDDDM